MGWPRQSDNLSKASGENTPEHFRTIHHLKSTKPASEIQTPVAVGPVWKSDSRQASESERKGTVGIIARHSPLFLHLLRTSDQTISGSANARTQSKKKKNRKRKENVRNKQVLWPPKIKCRAGLLPVVGAHSSTHLFSRLP